jgi:hypothetical protein
MPAVLGYLQGNRRSRRFRRALRTVLVVSIALSAGIAWRWGPSAWQHASLLDRQRRCMNWSVPNGTVAYEEDPDRAALLLGSSSYAPMPSAVAQDMQLGGFPKARIAILQIDEAGGLLPAEVAGQGIAFMHRRRSPGGNERLVVVPIRVGIASASGYCMSLCDPIVLSPAPSWPPEPPRILSRGGQGPTMFAGWHRTEQGAAERGKPLIRFYAGQADPEDASHYSIRYEYFDNVFDENGVELGQSWKTNTLHGWLRDDDSVELMLAKPGPFWLNLLNLEESPRREKPASSGR